jgi:signal transduction histidine kinase
LKRLLLLLSQKENQRLLREELGRSYSILIGEREDDLDEEFDLCILDGPSLDRLQAHVQERKRREQPIYLPVLLVTSRPDVKMVTRHVWRSVDELIITPIQKPELRARIEILLRVRTLSLELRQRAEEAETAETSAREASRAKSDFLAHMSHELRTPINAITGYADLLELGIAGPLTEQQVAHLGRIKFSAGHLLALVNEVLNLAKVESGRLVVEAERVPLVETVREALDLIGPQAAQQEVELADEVTAGADAAFWGDRNRVRQILTNLLANAVKFTERGGRVSIASRLEAAAEANAGLSGPGGWIALEVRDTGIGIPLEKQESVFDPFVQVDASHTRERGGTGLGLTISRRLARLMGGDLSVRSIPGAGSCFTLTLPAVAGEAAEDRQALSSPVEVPRLAEVGHTLVRCAYDIMNLVAERLRGDPATPGAKGLDRPHLGDHGATFLVELGLMLAALDEGGAEAALMRDGAKIQRTISELHGAQRARLDWPAEALEREFELLREVTAAILRRTLPDAASGTVDEALRVVHRGLEEAERASLQGWTRARGEGL